MKKFAFGVDIGGTTVKLGLFDVLGTLIEKWEIPTRIADGGQQILPDVAEAIVEKLEELGADMDEVAGIGIGAPGAVQGGTTVNRCANLGWDVVNVAEEMKRLTGASQVRVGNDANVAALGEMWKGGGRGHQNVVMVTLGTGVGGGIIIDGRIVEGAFGAGGEIGHMTVDPEETAACGCGKRGHLEQYASATGIVRLAKAALTVGDQNGIRQEKDAADIPAGIAGMAAAGELTAKDVMDAAKAGDPLALSVLNKAFAILGRALASVACVVDPEVFVIGGGVSKAGDFLLDMLREHYRGYAFHASEGTKFTLAELGNDAGMYGAVRLVTGDSAD